MRNERRVVFLTYAGASLLDYAGPAAVFSTASRSSPTANYELIIASPGGWPVVHGCGTPVGTTDLNALRFGPDDTVIVIGAYEKALAAAMRDGDLKAALLAASTRAERYGSVCSGAFVLAAAGLLDGRRAATHWAGQKRLASDYPKVQVDADALYVVDQQLWTSAGVTTGIDMALAMVELDYGRELKSMVAKQLVVYAHRPGHQSQFSDLLLAQVQADERFRPLIQWLMNRLDGAVKVAEMADFMAMSERSFFRQFVAAFGETPAKLHERLRLNAAKQLLEAGAAIKRVVGQVGFRSEAAFRSAFKARFGVTPGLHQRMQA